MALPRLETLIPKGAPFNYTTMLRAFAQARFEEPLPPRTQAMFAVLDSGLATSINRLHQIEDREKTGGDIYAKITAHINKRDATAPSADDPNKLLRELSGELERVATTREALDKSSKTLIKEALASVQSSRSLPSQSDFTREVNTLEGSINATISRLESLYQTVFHQVREEKRAGMPTPDFGR